MMVCGHSALIGIYCQDFKPPAAPLYPTWDKYPIPRGGGLSTCLVNISPYSVELGSKIVR